MTYFLDRIEALPCGVWGYIGNYGFAVLEGEAQAELGQVALRLRPDLGYQTPLELDEALNRVGEGVLGSVPKFAASYRARVLELPPELRGEAAFECAKSLCHALEVEEGLDLEQMAHDVRWTLVSACPERTLDFVASVGYERAIQTYARCAAEMLRWDAITAREEGSSIWNGCEHDLEFCEVWQEPMAPSVEVGRTFCSQSGLQ